MEERQDLISRQVAIDALRDAENHAFNSFYKGLAKAHKIIADLPSVQPEIIRCEDCIHYNKHEDCIKYQRDGFCSEWVRNTYKDWYCSRAERRKHER